MIRPLAALAAALALCACARQETAPAPPPAPSAPSPALTPPPPAPAPASSPGAQSESEEASASQESAGTEGEHKEKSDASLERIAALPPAAQLPSGKWQPGVNYNALLPAQPTSVSAGKVEVLEIFWFGCPRCYTLEASLQAWQKSKAAYIEFVRVPVDWKGVQAAHARLFYTLTALNRQDLVAKAFDTIHNATASTAPPLFGATDADTLRQQQQFAVANGVSVDDFARAYNSPGVTAALAHADEITQRYRVEAVPLFAVNGKYTTDVSQAGSEEKLIALLNDLAAAEHTH
jgi:thiol:disulfide interchange protein DsbA